MNKHEIPSEDITLSEQDDEVQPILLKDQEREIIDHLQRIFAAGQVVSIKADKRRFEALIIEQALVAASGVILEAAPLVSISRQWMTYILNKRHPQLLPLCRPIQHRRKSSRETEVNKDDEQ